MKLVKWTYNNTEIRTQTLLKWLGISKSKFYDWISKDGLHISHNANLPKSHWILEWEKQAIIDYARNKPQEGYRRLCYMMLDENVVAVSPSTVYRVLRKAGLLNRWNTVCLKGKGGGFSQPNKFNEHWHTDIKYVNFKGTFLFLISVIDGYSRFIIHNELRTHMQESDIQLVIQRAVEKYPDAKPRLITDNGSQFVSKDFAKYLNFVGMQHIRTSVMYPQSNGKIERFHRTIHEECVSRNSMINLQDARLQIAKYVDYYNTQRLHSSLYYLTPDDYVNNRIDEKLQLRRKKLVDAKVNRLLIKNAV